MKKVLFSVLLVCLVAAMVGAGTWAYFSDYEHSNDNYFAGGTLDLRVDGMDDPDVVTYFEVECVAPGDEGAVTISLCNEGCVDGEADLHMTMTVNDDNGIAEPESDVDTTDGPGNGELCQSLMMRISVDLDDNGSYETVIIEGAFIDLECINWILGDLSAESCIGLQIEWWVPTSVGNEVMTDLCGFDVEFSLNQKQAVYEYYDLTVSSPNCCPVYVGAPVNQVVPQGSAVTFSDLPCLAQISLDADDSGADCDFDQWTGDTDLGAAFDPNTVTMDGDKTVEVWCFGPSPYTLTVDQSGSCCDVHWSYDASSGTVFAGQTDTIPSMAGGTVVTVTADDSDPCCEFDSWSDGGARSHDIVIIGAEWVSAYCHLLDSDLTVESIGCCDVQVDWTAAGGAQSVTVPAGQSEVIPDLPCCTQVTVTAIPNGPLCY